MPSIQITGTIPAVMRENARPGDWVANLALTGDIGLITAIETTGTAALHFAVRWNAAIGLATLSPAAPVDFEAFAAAGIPPQLNFSLRFVFANGSSLADATLYTVTILDADDTPPSDLHFATGGSVTAGEIGSVIGTLAWTDPDTAGPFFFSFAEEDAWRFEVVGSTLKLRDGISLGLDEMPSHPLFISVSDGKQSAAFTLDLTVRDPAAQESTVPIVTPGLPQSGFALTEPQQAVALRESRDVTAVNTHGEDLRQLMLAEGGAVWLQAVETLRLADGWVDYRPEGDAVRAAALHATLTGQAATGAQLGAMVGQAVAGQGWVDLAAQWMPQAMAGLDDADLVIALYRMALDRDPDAAELALQAGRLASGVARAQIVADLAGSAAALAAQAEPDGHWVSQPLGGSAAWHRDTGGLPAGFSALPSEPIGAAWIL